MNQALPTLALALALTTASAPLSAEVPDHDPRSEYRTRTNAETRTKSMRELNREVKQHHRMLKRYRRIDLDKGLWPNSKRVYSTDLVVLEAPLAKTVGPEKIEIEWFHTAIDNYGQVVSAGRSGIAVTHWIRSLWDAKIPVEFRIRMVGEGIGLNDRFREERKLHQELMLYDGDWLGLKGNREVRRLARKGIFSDEVPLRGRWDAEQIVEQAGERLERWNALRVGAYARKRMETADSRWSQMFEQARRINGRILKGPADPIILINGKYLITRTTAKGVEKALLTANGVIEWELKKRPQHDFQIKEMEWGEERHPRRGEMIRLREGFAIEDNGKIDVEWLYTYVDQDGQATQVAMAGEGT